MPPLAPPLLRLIRPLHPPRLLAPPQEASHRASAGGRSRASGEAADDPPGGGLTGLRRGRGRGRLARLLREPTLYHSDRPPGKSGPPGRRIPALCRKPASEADHRLPPGRRRGPAGHDRPAPGRRARLGSWVRLVSAESPGKPPAGSAPARRQTPSEGRYPARREGRRGLLLTAPPPVLTGSRRGRRQEAMNPLWKLICIGPKADSRRPATGRRDSPNWVCGVAAGRGILRRDTGLSVGLTDRAGSSGGLRPVFHFSG